MRKPDLFNKYFTSRSLLKRTQHNSPTSSTRDSRIKVLLGSCINSRQFYRRVAGTQKGKMVLTTSSTAWTNTSRYTVVASVQSCTGLTSLWYFCNSCLLRWYRVEFLGWSVFMARIPENKRNLASLWDFRLFQTWWLPAEYSFSSPQSA